MKRIICVMLLLIVKTSGIGQVGSLEISIRAFIPDPKNAGRASGSIIPMPNGQGSMVSFAAYCFKSDNRGFSDDPKASSRIATDFIINPTSGTTASIIPNNGRTVAGTTSRLNCANGSITETKKGVVDRDAIGTPTVANGLIQAIGQVAGSNILTIAGDLGPSIDYNFDLQWNISTRTLTAKVNFSYFPAFEMYARQSGGKWIPIIQQLPTKTPLSLQVMPLALTQKLGPSLIKYP